MKKLLTLSLLIICYLSTLLAAPGDTTIIQTFSFDMPRNANKVGTFKFPSDGKKYSKVLMYYTIKCDPTGNYTQNDGIDYPCGEWDMIVYTDILSPSGEVDTAGNPVLFPKWRLLSYITPYGGGLERDIDVLNNEGWRYVFDVTDFLPILKGELTMRDGNYLELVDIKFAFIEGTPARDVKDIKPVWNSRYGKYNNDWNGFPMGDFDKIVKDTTFVLSQSETQAKLMTTITGHNFGKSNKNCGEFCNNIHTIKANGQVVKKWDILQSCADNAIYPQSGTWVYARAGWCPGLAGTLVETELTPYIKNSSISFDYDIESDPYGAYCMTSYLVTYGDFNHTDDVEAYGIISPSAHYTQRRLNPSAFSPVVVIKNTGKNTLTSATINYGFVGGDMLKYEWKGSLKYSEMDTVILTQIPDWNKVTGTSTQFYFEISQPNGKSDPTPYNNKLQVKANKPVIFNTNDFVLTFKTNKRPKETRWQIVDIAGNTLYSVLTDTLKSSKSYDTNINLPDGTYCLSYFDSGEDGLGWWANSSAGNGSSSLKTVIDGKKKNVFNLDIDFGSFFHYWFVVNKFSTDIDAINGDSNGSSAIVSDGAIEIYPNPVSGDAINVDISAIHAENPVVFIYDYLGQLLMAQPLEKSSISIVDIKHLTTGVYTLVIKDDKKRVASTKIIVEKK